MDLLCARLPHARRALAGAGSLLVLAGCGGTGAPAPAASPSTAAVGVEVDVDTVACAHPAGFTVSHPADWSVNPGEVLPVCSWFAADPFTVPEGTDARIADITLTVRTGVDPAAPLPDESVRARLEVGGREAVRVEQVASPGLYPAGTPITTYVVDLPGERTLVARTVGLPGADHDRDVAVLDAMMASLVVDAATTV